MKKLFTTIIIPYVSLLVVMTSCNNPPKYVSGSDFKTEYELGVNQTMKQSIYLGETNDIFYLSHKTRSLINGAWKEKIWYTKSSDLEPGFLGELKKLNRKKT